MKESRYNVWVEHDGAHYVYNGMSGALLRVPDQEHTALRAVLDGDNPKLAETCPATLVADMMKGRMLVGDTFDELDLLQRRYHASRYDTQHFALTIVTSLGCNFDCPYCYEDKHASILSPATQALLLKVLDDKLPEITNLTVNWFGGEPLVGRRSLLALSDAFIQRCDGAGVQYHASMTTNGYLLSKKVCAELKERRVSSAQITIDGPPDVHDRMRPLESGRGTFWKIIQNLHHAIDYLDISIRVNVDKGNIGRVEELLQILQREGFSNRLTVGPGQLTTIDDGVPSPSTTYAGQCFTNYEYAHVEHEFSRLAARYGFSPPHIPRPTGAPCTAVRVNELIVGSKGELYKCYESVGNMFEVIGHLRHYEQTNGRLARWIKYNPFEDAECRSCIAMPVCMGGCAHHAMDPRLYDNRCDPFRHTYHEQILDFVQRAEEAGADGLQRAAPAMPRLEKAR